MIPEQGKFQDFTEFFSPLELPYEGQVYRIPYVSAELGSYLKLVAEQAAKVLEVVGRNEEALTAAQEAGKERPEMEPLPQMEVELPKKFKNKETHELMLGDQLVRKMKKDGVSHAFMVHAGMTAYQEFVFGRNAALAYWNSGGDPKAVAATLPGSNIFTKNTDEENTTQ